MLPKQFNMMNIKKKLPKQLQFGENTASGLTHSSPGLLIPHMSKQYTTIIFKAEVLQNQLLFL